jgi:hypothetical protein
MVSNNGLRVLGTNSADTGTDGTLYFVGAVEVRPAPGQPVQAGGKIGSVWYRLALITYRPPHDPGSDSQLDGFFNLKSPVRSHISVNLLCPGICASYQPQLGRLLHRIRRRYEH